MNVYIGIDPGAKGGIAWIGGQNHAEPLPMAGKDVNGHKLAAMLRGIPGILTAVVEKSQAMPGNGSVSMYRYGENNGIIKGVLQALNVPYTLVTPQAWKRQILAGTAKDKDAAINYVRNAHPWVDLTPGRKRTPHDGVADALCIAEYARSRA